MQTIEKKSRIITVTLATTDRKPEDFISATAIASKEQAPLIINHS